MVKNTWLLCCIPSPSQSGQWWKQPSALTTWGPHTIYLPENEPFALMSPRKNLKFIECFLLFFFGGFFLFILFSFVLFWFPLYLAKYTQFEAWPGLCSAIPSWRRCQHGQQSVTAWTSRTLHFLQHHFKKKRANYVTENEQSLNSDTRDLLGNWIKINNLRVYSVFLQSIL